MVVAVQHKSRTEGKLTMRWASEERELLTPDEARLLHEENVIVIYGNRYPLLGRRLNFTKHPYWKKAQLLPRLELRDLNPSLAPIATNLGHSSVPFDFPS